MHDRKTRFRVVCFSLALVVGFGIFSQFVTQVLIDKNYQVSSQINRLAGDPIPNLTQSLKFDSRTNAYQYNQDYIPSLEVAGHSVRPKFTALFHKSPSLGVQVTDPVSKASMTIKPKFQLAEPRQDQNRLLYPVKGKNAVKVYSLKATGFKEDIILHSYSRDTLDFTYSLELASGTEARLEQDGSLAVYGTTNALLGEVSTATDADQQLLDKARQNSPKNNLLFTIPAPIVRELGKNTSDVKSRFSLNGNELTIHTSGLREASYPLSIDPSVYIESASQLMRGNNETNVDFDVENQLIKKGSTTGARFDALTSTLALPQARWGHGTAVAGGYVYAAGGNNGSANQSTVYWAKFLASGGDGEETPRTIESPNPGNGVCSGWCTNSAYDLPAPRTGLSLAAYNGFLYAVGGKDASCSGANNACNTVFIAKLGANGEPSLWHPTGGTPVYWYEAGNLSTERSYAGVSAYNNRLYLLGGQTNSSSGGVNTVEYANINPTGNLGAWTSLTSLPSVRFSHSAQIYNDRLYVIGGNSGGSSLQNTVHYIKILDNGTLASSWVSANSFTTARQSWGGNFSAVWGGYMYISGGCAAIDAQGECTSTGISSGGTVELASINADGSISNWGTIGGVTNARIGYGFVSWRNSLYTIGGCAAQNTTTGACTTTLTTTNYGSINQDGEASTVDISVSSSNAPCNNTTPKNCNLPSGIGNMLSSTAIMNGYLYIIGGCTNSSCSTTGNTAYTAINPDGSLSMPSACPGGTTVDSFCLDTTNPIPGGLLAAGTTIFNGRIYVIGGQSGGSLKGNIYHIGVNPNGSLNGVWAVQSFTNIAATSVSYTYAYARANPSSAGTYPGNLYIFGGCSGGASGAGCPSGSNTQAVYKCNILTNGYLEEDNANDCTTDGQLQIGTVPGATGTGLALHTGTVYANYIYLIGGVAPGMLDLATLRYAKFDNNNNVVAATGSGWAEPVDSFGQPVEMTIGRRRGSSFGYNGYLYVLGGYDASGGGVLADIQFAKINVSNGSIEQFEESDVTINNRWGLSVSVSSSYAYVVGGCTVGASPSCSTVTNTIQTFQIYNNDSGTPAGYSASSNQFGTDRFGASSTIHNGYVYVAGGCISSTTDCNDATSNVQYAPINDDGSIGAWSSTTASLPADRAFGQLEQAGGTLYYIGGQDDSEAPQTTIYYATPSSGNITSWSVASNGLPSARTQLSAASWNNRLYITGGVGSGTGCTGGVCSSVYVTPQLNSGGNISSALTTTTSFGVDRSGHTAIAYANNLYILGGYDGSNYLNDVQFTQINADGTVDPWSFTTSLPTTVRQGDGFAVNGYIYLFGGRISDGGCTDRTLVAPISANTTVASGNNPTGIGEWYETNTKFTGKRYGITASDYDGKAYIFGGACEAGSFPPVDSVTSTVFSANSTAHNVEMPGYVEAGDLLLVLFTNDGSATVTDPDGAGGWTQQTTAANGTNVRGSVWAKVADGSEGGTTVNFVTSGSETAAAQVYHVLAAYWEGSLSGGVAASSGVSSTTQNPNPPSLDPAAWGTEDTTWIAYAAGGTYTSVTTYPSGFTNGLHNNGGTGTSGASVGSARIRSATASIDPGSFTMNARQSSVAFTIAIRPAAAAMILTGTDRAVQTTLLSQPQVARYSRMIDTDSDVFPIAWLMNGIDNSIGARWRLRYRSMHDLDTAINPNEDCGTSATMPQMTTWGQETNFGNVTLGTPETYVAREAGGGNINCARYYYFSISIDSSQAFGYPEDVERGPTLNDLSLFFTADPSKRLRHGKTFTGGELQPLDTPF